MRLVITLPLLAAAVVACAGRQSPPAPVPAAVQIGAEVERIGSVPNQRAALSTEVLPSLASTTTIKADTPLLQRPKTGSVILKTLAAGEGVQLLGEVSNADGQWRSVAAGELQGWVRAGEISSP